MSTSKVFTVGQVLTAAQMNDLPQGVLTSATVTSDVGPTSGTTELDVITASAVTLASATRRLRITFHARAVTGTITGDQFTLRIKEGATILAEQTQMYGTSVTAFSSDFIAIIATPSAASHTYKATIQRVAGTGTATVNGSAAGPINLVVEDVGD